jgi:hypothetical protein
MWEGKRNPYTLLVGMQVSPTTVKISMEVHQETKIRTAV